MVHKSKIIASRELADGAIAVCARCCDDSSTDSWFTIYQLQELEQDDLRRMTAGHCSNVEARHEAKMRAKAFLDTLISSG